MVDSPTFADADQPVTPDARLRVTPIGSSTPTPTFDDSSPVIPLQSQTMGPKFDDSSPVIPLGSDEPADHGLAQRQKLSPVGKALSPITGYWPNVQHFEKEGLNQASEGLHEMFHPDTSQGPLQSHTVQDIAAGAGKAALGTIGYVGAPISAAYRSLVGQPVEDVTGIPREYTEFAAQLATPYIGLTGPKLPTAPTAPPRPALPVNRFGVTESAGQASQDLPTIRAEQGALRGQAGPPAEKHATEFFENQQPAQLTEANRNVSKSLDVPGSTGIDPVTGLQQGQEIATKPTEAADIVQKSLQKESARQKADVKAKYDYAKSLPGQIDAETFKDMPITIREEIGPTGSPSDPVYVDDGTPNAAKMLRYLNDRIGELNIRNDAALSSPVKSQISGVTLEGVEQWRKALSGFRADALKAYGSNASDARAAQAIMRAFDKKIAEAVNSGAFRGDPRAVQAFNDARAAHAERMKLWGNDNIGRRLQSIIGDPRFEKDPATLNDVARWLYGEAGSSNSLNVGTVKRIRKILGDQSPEWSAIKQGLFRQLVDKAGATRGDKAISNRLREFLVGKGSDLANEVYSPAERDMLNAYADMYDRLDVPLTGANWPNTAAGVIPHIKKMGTRITGAVGALIGHAIWPGLGGEVGGYVAGEQVGKALTKAEETRNYKKIANMLPMITQRFKVWQQAVQAQQRMHTVQTQARLTAAAANLTNALTKLHSAHPEFAKMLTQGPSGPGTSNAEPQQRAKGGKVQPVLPIDPDVSDDDADQLAEQMIEGAKHFADGGVPTADDVATPFVDADQPIAPGERLRVTPGNDGAKGTQTTVDQPNWQDIEAQSNLAAIQSAQPAPAPESTDTSKLPDVGEMRAGILKDLAETPFSKGTPQGNALFGTGEGERYQTWPERMVRSGATLAHDVGTGEVPQYEMDPATGEMHTSNEMVQRSQDMAGMAGSGGLANPEGGAVLNATPSLRPALKYNGKIYKAPPGGEHADAMPPQLYNEYQKQALSGEDMSTFDFGFMNHKGHFLSREDALRYAIDNDLIDKNYFNQNTIDKISKGGGGLPSDFLRETSQARNLKPTYFDRNTSVLRSETSKPGAALAGAEHAQPFYSAVEKTIQAAPQSKMHGVQWANWLKNQPGVKPDELQYTGLDNWLRSQQGPVTKQQVQDHFAQNKVQVNDVVRGGKPQDSYKSWNELNRREREHVLDWYKEMVSTHEDEDEPYLLSDLDEQGIRHPRVAEAYENAPDIFDFQKEEVEPHFDDPADLMAYRLRNAANPDRLPTKYQDYQLPGGENYREHLLTLPDRTPPKTGDPMKDIESAVSADNYRSGHWDEPNILAHARTNEREVAGKPSFHIEELQSDWHQQGRKQGYKAEIDPEISRVAHEAVARVRGNSNNRMTGGPEFVSDHQADAWLDSDKITEKEWNAIKDYGKAWIKRANHVPDAPFKTTWPELAMKRMIQRAVSEGKDRISWTPGEAQAARYDLSKHYSEIGVVKEQGNFFWWPRTISGHGVGSIKTDSTGKILSANGRFGDIEGKNIEDVVGKDIAEKGLGTKDEVHLKGLDLKVGGEGMKGFYDQMLPKMVEKLGKQYGVKVKQGETTGEIPREDNWMSGERAMELLGISHKEWEANAHSPQWRDDVFARARAKLAKEAKEQKVPYFDIPEKMKQDVLSKGFPLFSDTSPSAALLQSYDSDKKNVERPKEKEPAARAHGGRVVASLMNHEPTEAQIKAGNYAKEHVNIFGLNITIENARGKERSGIGKDGKRWSVKMPSHYGYFKRTVGADKDHVDVYLGPHVKSNKVFVVNQVDANTKKFDETKVMLGFASLDQALNTYTKGFSDGKGKDRIGSIVPTTIDDLKDWLKGDTHHKPYRTPMTYGRTKYKGVTVDQQV